MDRYCQSDVMDKDTNGEWVLYEDAQSVITELMYKLSVNEKKLTYWENIMSEVKVNTIREMVSSMLPKFAGVNSKLVVKDIEEYTNNLSKNGES